VYFWVFGKGSGDASEHKGERQQAQLKRNGIELGLASERVQASSIFTNTFYPEPESRMRRAKRLAGCAG